MVDKFLVVERIERPWLSTVEPNRCAKMRLFCFPHAGGGASAYSNWHRLLPEVEVTAIQLPGHENRIGEPLRTDIQQIVEELYQAFVTNFQLCFDENLPFLFFGHSMGALLAFELVRRLRNGRLPMPSMLIVSAHRAPHLLSLDKPIHQLVDNQFLQKIAEMEGTSAKLLAMPEFREIWLPILRADFEMCETYQYVSHPPLNLPIVALHGKDDPQVQISEIRAWSLHSQCSFLTYRLPGEHFYLHTHRDPFIIALRQIIGKAIGSQMRGSHVH